MTMTLTERLEQAVRVVQDFPVPGISFKDITPVLLDAKLLRDAAEAMALPFAGQVTKVVGIESRGFLLGPLIAQVLGCGFVIVRKQGKLPLATTAITYALEYGSATIEIHRDALNPTDKVLVHDDLLATGGTAAAAAELVRRLGASVAGYSFLIELQFLQGRVALEPLPGPVVSLLSYKA